MADDRRKNRQVIQALQSESTWLQKALFALTKVEEARERRAEIQGADSDPLEIKVGKTAVTLAAVEEALEDRVSVLMEDVRERRKVVR